MDGQTIVNLYAQEVSQRENLDNQLQDISNFITPGRNQYQSDMLSEHETSWTREHIYDNTAIVACKRLASFIHGSLTSPYIKWFSLLFRNEEMNTTPAFKEWLEDSEERMWKAYGESDLDNCAAEMYLDIASIGTGFIMVEPGGELEWDGLDFTAMPVMDTYFDMGPDGMPYRAYRRIRYTKYELEKRFPDMPDEVQIDDEEASSIDAKIQVIFCVYYRDKDAVGDQKVLKPEDRPVGYKYVMLNGGVELEEGGYYEWPVMVVRWDKMAGNKWGGSPGQDLLPNIMHLNEVVAQSSEAGLKAIDPPYVGTERNVIGQLDLEPGGFTVVTDMDGLQPLLSATDFAVVDNQVERLQGSIERGFLIDQITYKNSPAMTATEVMERKQIMMQSASTTLGRLKTDFLNPTVMIAFYMMLRQGQLLPPPEGMDITELDVEYVSPMPRAQKADQAMGIEAWLNTMGEFFEMFPEMRDIVDVDNTVRRLAELRGVDAKLMHNEDEVKKTRAARAEQEQQMQEAQNMAAGGQAMQEVGKGATAMQEAGVEQ